MVSERTLDRGAEDGSHGTYVKPGMMENSFVIFPPLSVIFFLAASSSPLSAPDLRVTYAWSQHYSLPVSRNMSIGSC